MARAGLEPGTAGLRVRRADHSATLPSKFVACDRPVSGNNRLVFFEDISDHSYSCLLSSTKSPLIIAISFAILEQSRVSLSFVFAGQARRVLCINSAPPRPAPPAPLKCLTEQKNPFEVCKLAARYNGFGCKSSYQKKILAKISLPKKNPEIENFNSPKSFGPGHLKLEYPPPPRMSSYQKF